MLGSCCLQDKAKLLSYELERAEADYAREQANFAAMTEKRKTAATDAVQVCAMCCGHNVPGGCGRVNTAVLRSAAVGVVARSSIQWSYGGQSATEANRRLRFAVLQSKIVGLRAKNDEEIAAEVDGEATRESATGPGASQRLGYPSPLAMFGNRMRSDDADEFRCSFDKTCVSDAGIADMKKIRLETQEMRSAQALQVMLQPWQPA